MGRVIERSSSATSLSESIEILRVLSLAAASLTRMARTQKYLEGSSGGGSLEELTTLIAETRHEFQKEGVHQYLFRFVFFRGTNPQILKGKISWDIHIHFTSIPRRNSSTNCSKKDGILSRKHF